MNRMKVGGLGGEQTVGEAEQAMVQDVKKYVENFKNITYESFTAVGMKTQVVC